MEFNDNRCQLSLLQITLRHELKSWPDKSMRVAEKDVVKGQRNVVDEAITTMRKVIPTVPKLS